MLSRCPKIVCFYLLAALHSAFACQPGHFICIPRSQHHLRFVISHVADLWVASKYPNATRTIIIWPTRHSANRMPKIIIILLHMRIMASLVSIMCSQCFRITRHCFDFNI